MAEFNGNQYDGFSFNPSSIGTDWQSGNQRPLRAPNAALSIFNIDYMGTRNADNYYRTSLGFGFKGTIENPKQQYGVGYGTDPGVYTYNPYIWGLAVAHLKMLNDSMFIMGMAHAGRKLSDYGDNGADINKPRRDVMDEKNIAAEGMLAYHNYPGEGFSSFGKKGDKERAWLGNSWINGRV
jgi:hypothetical protein